MPYQISDPFDHLTDLRRRLYRVLESAAPAGPAAPTPYSPPLDICHTPEGVVITVELPGVKREAIAVELEGDLLTISGERPALPAEAGTVHRQERPTGRFARSLSLTQGRDREISASLADGVLTVRVSPPAGGEQ